MDAPREGTLEALSAPLRALHDRFAELTEPHRPALWRYCLRLTGSAWDAEDLVQETLTRAFARLKNFWQPLDPRAYLFRIASNAWIDTLRRARVPLDELDEAAAVADPDGAPLSEETWDAMETLVGLLPPRQRVVVLLVDVFGFRPAEAAALLGTSEGAVKAALHRARDALRRHAAAGEPATPATPPAPRPPVAVVARYLDAFNRRDPDAVAALLARDATADIVGVAEEHGAETIRKYSLADWAAEPEPQWAEPAVIDGREAVCVYHRTPDHDRALAWLILLDVAGGRITRMRGYYFCPELIRYAAERLGVPAVTHGYRYVPPAPAAGTP